MTMLDTPAVIDDAAVAEGTANCPVCGGDGFLIADDDAEIQCEACDGSGQRPPDIQAA